MTDNTPAWDGAPLVHDREGDAWMRQPDGKYYDIVHGVTAVWLERNYGPCTVVEPEDMYESAPEIDTSSERVDEITVMWRSGEPADELLRVARMEGARVVLSHSGGLIVQGPVSYVDSAGMDVGSSVMGYRLMFDRTSVAVAVTAPKPVEPEWHKALVVEVDGKAYRAGIGGNNLWSDFHSGTFTTDYLEELGEVRVVVDADGKVVR